jgi:hypothetical protein
MIVGAAAAVVLLAAGGVFGYLKMSNGAIIATVEPPEATISAQFDSGAPPLQGTGRLEAKARKETRVTLTARYPGLTDTTTNVVVQGGETIEVKVSIPHGIVRIEARDSGKPLEATIANPASTNKTPYTFYVARDGPAPSFTVFLDGFLPQDVKTAGRLGETTNIIVNLTRAAPDEKPVAISLQSSPFGAEVILDGQTNVLPYRQWLVEGKSYVAVARYLDWAPLTNHFTATEKSNRISFTFPFGVVRFECPNCPSGVGNVYVGSRKIADTPKEVPWPEGEVEFILRAEGYDDALRRVRVRNGDRIVIATNLNRTVGIVQLNTSPGGAEILDGSGKKVGDTAGDKPVRLLLPPGPYSFSARHPYLGTIGPTNLMVVKAQTSSVLLRFDYSELALVSDPPGGEFRDPASPSSDWRAMQDMGRLILKPGANAVKVRHPKLYEEEVKLDLTRWTTKTQLVQFAYASLVVTSLPPETMILIDGTPRKLPAGGWVEPLVRLAPMEFTLTYVTNNQTLRGVVRFPLEQRGRYTNGFNFIRREWRNSLGMELVWLPKTDQGGGFWVGKHEVTRDQFKQLISTDPSVLPMGDTQRSNLPVDSISVAEARAFCSKLLGRDREKARVPELERGSHDGTYGLPTEEEWSYYAKGSKPVNAVTSVGLSVPQKRKGPEPVGSAPADELGLHDVKGNLWELCETKSEGFVKIGGGFGSISAGSLEGKGVFGRFPAAGTNEPNRETGFRVIFRPVGP